MEINKQIKVGIQLILKNSKGEYLLLKRAKNFGFGEWEMIGGHLEFGEEFENCLVREAREEAGIEVKVGKLVSVAANTGYGNHYIILAFEGDLVSGEAVNIEPESHSEIGWFGKDNLPENLFVSTKKAFEDYFAGVVYNNP